MTRLLFSTAIVFLISNSLISQETPLRINYSPNSPEVSSLFDFNDVETGNYTGAVNLNIPLTSLTSGPISTSVSLSYNSSSVDVTQRATWAGLGWNLNTGGAIFREVRGLPDDTDTGFGFLKFLFHHGYDSIGDIAILNTTDKVNLYQQLSLFGCEDAQPDVFSFMAGDLSGKFMFDWDGSIKVSCNRKIKTPDYTQAQNSYEIDQWEIVDDHGTKYIFSKKETNERTGVYGMGVLDCGNNPYTTSWKLTSIQDVSEQHQINFSYEDYEMNYPVEYSKQHTITLAGASGQVNSSGSGLKINGSYIKTITNTNSLDKIEFTTDILNPRTDVNGTNLYPLGKIKRTDSHNKTIDEYNFEFSPYSRLQLHKINKLTTQTSIDYYKFEYNNISLPPYTSYASDHWGYYNGENNSVPYPPFVITPNSTPIVHAGANKNPNPIYSEAGILKKIIYPTKGYTEFKYEGNEYSFIQLDQIPTQYDQVSQSTSSSVTGNPNNNGQLVEDNEYFEVIINRTTDNDNTICSPYPCKRKIQLNLSAVNNCQSGGTNVSPRFIIYNSSNQVVFQKLSIEFNPDYENGVQYNEIITLWLPDDTYRLYTATRNCPSPNIINFISVNPTWHNDTTVLFKKQAGGVRIKEISEFNYGDELLKKREFEYNVNDNPNLSSGSITSLPKYEDVFSYWQYFSDPNGGRCILFSNIVRYSGSLLMLGESSKNVRYREVAIIQVSGLDKLKTLYKYSQGDVDGISLEKPYPPISTKSYKKGLLLSETSFRHINNIFEPVNEVKYEYAYDNVSVEALKVSRSIQEEPSCHSNSSGLANYADAYYTNYIGHNQLINKKEKSFLNSSEVEIESDYSYDQYLNRVLLKSQIGSNGDVFSTEYTYPDTDNISTTNALMISKNVVATPIKQEISKNGSLLSTQLIKYKDWGNSIILPEIVQTAKANITVANPLDDISIVFDYDNLGNPLESSKANGIHVVYVWGYKEQYPIAKIENATYSQVLSQVSNLKVKSDADNDRTIGASGNEGLLRTALQSLRISLPNAMVTTYTYDPLIGVTSITDPKGYIVYYEYDEFNRLKRVKDAAGNIVSENDYHYKNQQ